MTKVFTRIWVKNQMIDSFDATEENTRILLRDRGLHIQDNESWTDYGNINGIRDIYINSSRIEKLYARDIEPKDKKES